MDSKWFFAPRAWGKTKSGASLSALHGCCTLEQSALRTWSYHQVVVWIYQSHVICLCLLLLLLWMVMIHHYRYFLKLLMIVVISSLFLFLFQSPRIGVLEKCWRLVGKVARYGFLNLFLLRGCGAVSLTLPLRFINQDQYRAIAQHWGTAINGLCHSSVFQPSDWVLHAHIHRCKFYMTWHIYIYLYVCLDRICYT